MKVETLSFSHINQRGHPSTVPHACKCDPRRELSPCAALQGDGVLVFLKACVMGLEGIVSKRLGAKYRSGRCSSWIKVKNKTAPGYTRFREEA